MTFQGGSGAYGTGTVFELKSTAGGGWTWHVIYSFGSVSPADGSIPNSGLIFDGAGNLYGTTSSGGTATTCGGGGCGTAFELHPTAGGGWNEKILYNFNNNGTDGYTPGSGLVFDAAGHLYGTTDGGGNGTNCGNGSSCGTAFVLVHKTGGGWAEKILHNFSNNGTDGLVPRAGLLLGKAGTLFGTTIGGGASNYGAVYEIKP